jgi:hypothetical protein
MNVVFVVSLFVGTAAIACWIVTRFPGLAPRSMRLRTLGTLLSLLVVQLAPVPTGSLMTMCLTALGVSIVLLVVWLHALWMLQGARDLLT